jgi:hypothetical protein
MESLYVIKFFRKDPKAIKKQIENFTLRVKNGLNFNLSESKTSLPPIFVPQKAVFSTCVEPSPPLLEEICATRTAYTIRPRELNFGSRSLLG